MSVKVERKTQDGVEFEVVTLEHEGREFSALGSVVDRETGRIVGYVSPDGTRLQRSDGSDMGIALRHVSSWPVRSFMGSTMHAYRTTVDGVTYTGRGFGAQMLLKLRAGRRAR